MKQDIILVFVSVFFSFVLAESIVRVAGYEPWNPRPYFPQFKNVEVVFEPDPVLGWRNRPGRFLFDRKDGRTVIQTNLPDGSRYTGPSPDGATKALIFVGGSYTYGWGLSDEETLPWRIQAALPQLRVKNFGTGGYGSYQSLLGIEKILATERLPPTIFVYGFNDFHYARDVAREDWLYAMNAYSASGEPVYMPYVSLDARGRLRRHPPEAYGGWPLRRFSALVALAEKT